MPLIKRKPRYWFQNRKAALQQFSFSFPRLFWNILLISQFHTWRLQWSMAYNTNTEASFTPQPVVVQDNIMLKTLMGIVWSRKGNTHITASSGLHILTPVCWSPAALLHSQQPPHCLRTCSQLLDSPTTTKAQAGLIIWSHDLSLREQCKSYHADKVRVECLEQQLHQQRLVLLNELVTLQRGEQSHTP